MNSWISTLLKKSYKQGTLNLSDLYDLLPALESTRLTERLEANWIDETKQTKHTPSLVRATVKTMGWRPFLIGLLLVPNVGQHARVHRSSFLLIQELAKFSQPILLTFLMGFFGSCPTISPGHAWLLAAGTVLASLTSSLIYHQVGRMLMALHRTRRSCFLRSKYFYHITVFALQMRVAYSGLIFRKVNRSSSLFDCTHR